MNVIPWNPFTTSASPIRAYCSFTGTMAPINQAPNPCFAEPIALQITPQVWNPGLNAPTGAFKTGASTTCRIFRQSSNGWTQPENPILADANGVCTTRQPIYLAGDVVSVQFCIDSTPACVTGDYSATKSVMYCPLPSIASFPPTALCGAGTGAGIVPFFSWGSMATGPPTAKFYMPILAVPGDATNGMSSATAEQLGWEYSNNSTSYFTSAATCYVKTNPSGNLGCDPTGNALGVFPLAMRIQPTGTFPAAPYAFGYSSFTPVDPAPRRLLVEY